MRLGGLTEVAAVLGVSRQRVLQLRQREEFPLPIGEIAHGAIWDLDIVEAWATSGLRKEGPGRPTTSVAKRTLGKRFAMEDDPVGRGGFADVFRALDRRTNETVAVKVLRNLDDLEPEAVRRFARELRLMQEIKHPNVMPILAGGEVVQDEAIWFAMPLASGSLNDYVSSVQGNATMIYDIVSQICAGLSHVHDSGIIHRDLKPANVLLRESGVWAISDFGLASEVERKTTALTSTIRNGLGSFWYTAPEQWTNARSADQRSDIYSLGKILQQLITGEAPVTSEMPAHIFRPIIERATAVKPEHRYQQITEFLEALGRAMTATAQVRIWSDVDATGNAMQVRVKSPATPMTELPSVLQWAETLDERDDDQMRAMEKVLVWMSEPQIAFLWKHDSATFRRVLQRFAEHAAESSFDYDLCDVLAAFGRRFFNVSADSGVLRAVLSYLVPLGAKHNRWFVRDLVVKLLAQLRDDELVVAAVETLLSLPLPQVRWTVTDFGLRTLPRSIRVSIDARLQKAG
jgi:serine/threonine protein kinase